VFLVSFQELGLDDISMLTQWDEYHLDTWDHEGFENVGDLDISDVSAPSDIYCCIYRLCLFRKRRPHAFRKEILPSYTLTRSQREVAYFSFLLMDDF